MKIIRSWVKALLALGAISHLIAQNQAPAFILRAREFSQSGMSISTIAWRMDRDGLDVTATPCEGRYILAFADNRPAPFRLNSVHTFLSKVDLFGYLFESDNLDPMVFQVKAEGYTWVRGKGTVKVPSGTPVLARDMTLLADERTYLLPPGREVGELARPPAVRIGESITVCGKPLQVQSIVRKVKVVNGNREMLPAEGHEFLVLRLKLGMAFESQAASSRVMLSIAGETGQRFKPPDEAKLTWDNLSQEPGIVIEVPKGMAPHVLEIEGIQFNISTIAVE